MPWPIKKLLTMKEEFVTLARQRQGSFGALCQRYGISRACGYKWLSRYEKAGLKGLEERSRRPRHHPHITPLELEERIVDLRQQNPAWGGRKLRRRLLDLGLKAVPSPSTITEVLRRRGLLIEPPSGPLGPWQRFEHLAPNDLWQMDFKAPLQTLRSGVCHPLTLLDDHSRFSLQLEPCHNQRLPSVQEALQSTFERYGLPRAILCDNGAPWRGADSAVLLALWVFGYCVWGSSSGMAGLITPKPKVKKNVFIARSKSNFSIAAPPGSIMSTVVASLKPSALATICIDPMKP